MKKLMEKGQSEVYRRQASHAVAIYYQIVANQPTASIEKKHPNQRKRIQSPSMEEQNYAKAESSRIPSSKTKDGNHAPKTNRNQPIPSAPCNRSETRARCENVRGNNSAEYKRSEKGSAWTVAKTNLANEIKVRHYSKNTLQTYCGWLTKFQAHAKNKNPTELTDEDFKNFLTFLAVNQKVAASTQNRHSMPSFSSSATSSRENPGKSSPSGPNRNLICRSSSPGKRSTESLETFQILTISSSAFYTAAASAFSNPSSSECKTSISTTAC